MTLPIEEAYARYERGEITYVEYREKHADPVERIRRARIDAANRRHQESVR